MKSNVYLGYPALQFVLFSYRISARDIPVLVHAGRRGGGKMIYCTFCGHELVKAFTGRFNEHSGERLFSFRCENAECEKGCRNMGGHFYKRAGFLWTALQCRNCGYENLGW
jgi:hypothetical protein